MTVHQNGQVVGAGYILSNELQCLLVTVAEMSWCGSLPEGLLRASLSPTCVHCLLFLSHNRPGLQYKGVYSGL